MPNMWYFLVIIFFFILIASFMAWRDENKKANELNNELEKEKDRSMPKLSGEMGFNAVAPAGQKNESSIVTITATIRNTGAPSIIDHIQISIKINENEISGLPIPLVAGQTAITLSSMDGQDIVLQYEDYLPKRGISQPIPTGGALFGFYHALIPNVKQEEIRSGSIVVLIFKDVIGNTYRVEHSMQSNKSGILIDPNKVQKRGY